MRDMHSHILPGVDDGAQNISESLYMLQEAQRVGVSSIVCTPHCRDPYFDFDKMWDTFEDFEKHAAGFPLSMGFEVNHRTLMRLGMDWAPYLGIENTQEFLLELSVGARPYQFKEYERTIFELQGMGYTVIIAHPERYNLIQKDVSVAKDLIRMGCKLQCSSDFIKGGRLGKEKKPAQRLLKEGLYDFIASDAHCVEHYTMLGEVLKRYRS